MKNETITISNAQLTVEIPVKQWQQSVEDACLATAQRGNQTPEQWARCIILTAEARRIQREDHKAAAAAQSAFVAEHLPNSAWSEPAWVCLHEFLATGWYRLDEDGLLAEDTQVRIGWEAIADIGTLYMAGWLASDDVQATEEQSQAMHQLDLDIERNVMPMSQFDILHRVIEPYRSERDEAIASHRARLRARYGIRQQTVR